MQINGYNFYGNDTQCQRTLIDTVNMKFDPIQEIGNGMCYMLSMQFLIDYLTSQNPPRQVFDQLTSGNNQYAYLRQIAGNFRAYISNDLNLKTLKDKTLEYIALLSRKSRTANLLCDFEYTSPPSPPLVINDRSQSHLAILYFKNSQGQMCGHAVSVVWDGTNYSLYDPNYGIYEANSTGDIYGTVLPRIYNTSSMHEFIFQVA